MVLMFSISKILEQFSYRREVNNEELSLPLNVNCVIYFQRSKTLSSILMYTISTSSLCSLLV